MAGAFSQYIEDAEDALGSPEKARNEATNFLNYTMLRGDHEFSRVEHSPAGPIDQRVGIMPRDQDFKQAATVLNVPRKALPGEGIEELKKLQPVIEQNLRDLWQERSIHPAETVADAKNDALLEHDLKQPQPPPIRLVKEDIDPETLAQGVTPAYTIEDASGNALAHARISIEGSTATIENIYANENPALSENPEVAARGQSYTLGPRSPRRRCANSRNRIQKSQSLRASVSPERAQICLASTASRARTLKFLFGHLALM